MSNRRTDTTVLAAPDRLADLEISGLLDATARDALDALTRAAHTALGADTTAAVSVVTAHEQVVVSVFTQGGGAPTGSTVPLSHSLCKRVVVDGEPYVVADATADPAHALAVRDFGVGAYLGSPVRGTRGTVLGAMCVVTPRPRHWTVHELSILGALAAAAEAAVALYAAARAERIARSSGAVPIDAPTRVQHDLRTPLTSILGFLELVLDDDTGTASLQDQQLHALRRSHASAERLLEAVDYLDRPAAARLTG